MPYASRGTGFAEVCRVHPTKAPDSRPPAHRGLAHDRVRRRGEDRPAAARTCLGDLTLDRYAHLFPDELDALSNALDGLKARTPADSSRTVAGSTALADITTRRLTGENGCGAGRT